MYLCLVAQLFLAASIHGYTGYAVDITIENPVTKVQMECFKNASFSGIFLALVNLIGYALEE